SAALRVSDQRIAVESKLPEIALWPSAEIASARTGPPCPRSCAKAELVPIGKAIETATSARSADRLLLRRAACAKTVRTIPLGPQRTPGLSRSSPLRCQSC